MASVNRLITLSETMDDSEIESWEVGDHRGEPRLILKGAGTVYCMLKFEQGVFRGRDVRGGYTELTPEKDSSADLRAIYSGRPIVPRVTRRPNPRKDEDTRRTLSVAKYQGEVDDLVKALPKTSKAAIAVVGCNRPHYMQQVIEGIQNSDTSDYDIILFLDKPRDQRDAEATQQQIDMGLTGNIIQYPVNYGCGRTLIDVRRQVFDNMGYEKAFIFEDDLVPGKNYLQFCENLLEWGQERYENIGAVQGWNKCLLPPDQKKLLTKQVHCTYTNWWGYLTTKAAWDQVKEFIYDYRRFLIGDYSVRPTVAILQFFKETANSNFSLLEGGLRPDETSLRHRRQLFDGIPSGQDGATWMAYDKANLVRLAPTVNRSMYIGKEGIHSTAQIFHKHRFDRMTIETHPQDKRRKKFEVR